MRINKPLLASSLLLSLTTLTAEASLTSYTAGGQNLVYSSISDITWTQDANLFKTMYDGNNNLINQIAAVTPTYTDSSWGLQTIDADDYNTDNGKMSWFGANAWVNYLNSINYGGSNQWRLPTVGSNPLYAYNQTSSELGQLFYSELGGTADNNIPNTITFINEQAGAYWLGTEYVSDPHFAWNFSAFNGFQSFFYEKDFKFNTWAVSPGQVAAVPVPGAVWLMGSGLLGLVSLKRRWYAL